MGIDSNETLMQNISIALDSLDGKLDINNNLLFTYRKEGEKYYPIVGKIEFPFVDNQDELINILKFIKKIYLKLLEVYKNNGSDDQFYTGKSIGKKIGKSIEQSNLYINNHMFFNHVGLDTKVLSYEGLKKQIPNKTVEFYNSFFSALSDLMNK